MGAGCSAHLASCAMKTVRGLLDAYHAKSPLSGPASRRAQPSSDHEIPRPCSALNVLRGSMERLENGYRVLMEGDLAIRVSEPKEGHFQLGLVGSLDLETASELEGALNRVCHDGARE